MTTSRIKALQLAPAQYAPGSPGPTVVLAKQRELYVLVHDRDAIKEITTDGNDDEYDEYNEANGTVWATLSVLVTQDPFPGLNIQNGHEMFWFKTYSENAGLLEQLERANWVKSTSRKIKQALVELPMVEVLLDEVEIAQCCALCEKFESTRDVERFQRCSRCKKRYYCSVEHQHEDWSDHKLDCKDLRAGNFAAVENRNRTKLTEMMRQWGGASMSL
ncbi:Egl nine 1 [Microbotryomycetes sp. JL221]|nr:Egl nine 1 [Microbotryomycetes sp. JL221]